MHLSVQYSVNYKKAKICSVYHPFELSKHTMLLVDSLKVNNTQFRGYSISCENLILFKSSAFKYPLQDVCTQFEMLPRNNY